jgi:hypothetical protein
VGLGPPTSAKHATHRGPKDWDPTQTAFRVLGRDGRSDEIRLEQQDRDTYFFTACVPTPARIPRALQQPLALRVWPPQRRLPVFRPALAGVASITTFNAPVFLRGLSVT